MDIEPDSGQIENCKKKERQHIFGDLITLLDIHDIQALIFDADSKVGENVFEGGPKNWVQKKVIFRRCQHDESVCESSWGRVTGRLLPILLMKKTFFKDTT